MATRSRIATALEAGGVRVAYTGQFSAPCALIEPGDPWGSVELSLGRKRVARWQLTLVAGRPDSEAALAALADLIDAADQALLTVPGVQLPTWAKPSDASLANVPYATTVATIQLTTAEEPLP
jgi:hypothetical protein